MKNKPPFPPVPLNGLGIVGRFPDGFEMTYTALWHLGGDETAHWELGKKLVEEHGGPPTFYEVENAQP